MLKFFTEYVERKYGAFGFRLDSADYVGMVMKKKICAALAALMLFCECFLCGFVSMPQASAGGGKIKGATYLGNEWQFNFWTAEHSQAPEDFQRIAADGFNTIVLLVPWRQFQPSMSKNTYDAASFNKLNQLMDQAADAGLGVVLRVGYTWDYAKGDDVLSRYQKLLYDDAVKSAWKNYAAKVYSEASAHANFAGAFLTWEDFWNFADSIPNLTAGPKTKQLAKTVGYTDYVKAHYTKEQLEEYYGNSADAADPSFPDRDSAAYALVYEWYDSFLNDILAETQEVFPGISMECRLDQDPVTTIDGRRIGYAHDATFACGSAPCSSVMLSAAMGYERGNVLSASMASGMGSSELSRTRGSGGKPVFVDQFLHIETTPGYEDLAHVKESDMNSYLSAMGSVFASSTIGYAVWASRDYTDNIIYNPEFGMDLDSWVGKGGVKVEEYNGSKMAHLSAGAQLVQSLAGKGYISSKPSNVRFKVISDGDVKLTVGLGGKEQTVNVTAGENNVKLSFESQYKDSLRIIADNECYIDNVQVYSHITEGGIYDIDGNPGRYLSGFKALNAKL